ATQGSPEWAYFGPSAGSGRPRIGPDGRHSPMPDSFCTSTETTGRGRPPARSQPDPAPRPVRGAPGEAGRADPACWRAAHRAVPQRRQPPGPGPAGRRCRGAPGDTHRCPGRCRGGQPMTPTIAQVRSAAVSQIGYNGTGTDANPHSKLGPWSGIDPGAWCAMSLSWCFARAGGALHIEPQKGFAYCPAGAAYYRRSNRWRGRNAVPEPGDIVFFDFAGAGEPHHVGLVE